MKPATFEVFDMLIPLNLFYQKNLSILLHKFSYKLFITFELLDLTS